MKLKDIYSMEKSYPQPRQHIKKQRHYFANKDPSSQGFGFSSGHVWMWVVDDKNKAGCWRIDAFELWCWRKLLRVPWTARRFNQSILNEISPVVFIGRTEAETLILWPHDRQSWLIWKRPWWWERLRAGGEGNDGGWNGWMASPTQWTWVWVNSGRWWWTARPGVLQFMGLRRVGHDWVTELNWYSRCYLLRINKSLVYWRIQLQLIALICYPMEFNTISTRDYFLTFRWISKFHCILNKQTNKQKQSKTSICVSLKFLYFSFSNSIFITIIFKKFLVFKSTRRCKIKNVSVTLFQSLFHRMFLSS